VIDATNRMGAPELNGRAAITAAAPDARYVRQHGGNRRLALRVVK
jgi:hypothetical protein